MEKNLLPEAWADLVMAMTDCLACNCEIKQDLVVLKPQGHFKGQFDQTGKFVFVPFPFPHRIGIPVQFNIDIQTKRNKLHKRVTDHTSSVSYCLKTLVLSQVKFL